MNFYVHVSFVGENFNAFRVPVAIHERFLCKIYSTVGVETFGVVLFSVTSVANNLA